MYEAYYGFKEKPFSMLPDPGFLFPSRKHQAALTLLEYGLLNHVGFCVISGEPGAGKTTILRALLERARADVTIGLITNTHQSFGGLLDWVLSAFDLHKPDLSQVEMHQIFMDFLIAEYGQQRTVLLIVDEAQNMKADTLEELRMLSNVNSEKDQLMQVVLSGQPELKDTLRRPELMQFAQRIAVDYHLEPLNLEETCGYIQHRLKTAGATRDVFTPAACERIFNYSGGTPRLINLLCETVLVYGFADQVEIIDVELIDEMVQERMKDSVVPLVNRDIVGTKVEENEDLVRDFPWIRPEGGNLGLKPEQEDQDADRKEVISQILEKKPSSESDLKQSQHDLGIQSADITHMPGQQGASSSESGSSSAAKSTPAPDADPEPDSTFELGSEQDQDIGSDSNASKNDSLNAEESIANNDTDTKNSESTVQHVSPITAKPSLGADDHTPLSKQVSEFLDDHESDAVAVNGGTQAEAINQASTKSQALKYGLVAAVIGIILIMTAVVLDRGGVLDEVSEEGRQTAEQLERERIQAEQRELQLKEQRRMEQARLEKLKQQAEAFKRERDEALRLAEDEKLAKKTVEEEAAAKAEAAIKEADKKRQQEEAKKLAAAKERERQAQIEAERARLEAKRVREQAEFLEQERQAMEKRLAEERLLAEQEVARLEAERLKAEQEAARKLAEEEAAEAAARKAAEEKAALSPDCVGPAARFKTKCR